MTETLNDKIKKLVTKVNSIQGSLLSMGKRLTALEEAEPEKFRDAPADNDLLNKIAIYLGFLKTDEKEEVSEPETEEVATEIEEEVISEEVLEALDEVIE